jgi:hypothetical protein
MPPRRRPNPDPSQLLDAVAAYVAEVCCPGVAAVRVKITLTQGKPLRVAMPPGWTVPAHAQEKAFIPTDVQERILIALEGRALTTDALAAAAGVDRSTPFKHPGGLKELREHGLVRHTPRLGFWRPDAPPPELAGEEGGDHA